MLAHLRIAVTDARGFIGRPLGRALCSQGHQGNRDRSSAGLPEGRQLVMGGVRAALVATLRNE